MRKLYTTYCEEYYNGTGFHPKALDEYGYLIHHLDDCDSVVDLGAGIGWGVQLLNESGFQAHGIDSSPSAVRIAQKLSIPVIRGDIDGYLYRYVQGEAVVEFARIKLEPGAQSERYALKVICENSTGPGCQCSPGPSTAAKLHHGIPSQWQAVHDAVEAGADEFAEVGDPWEQLR